MADLAGEGRVSGGRAARCEGDGPRFLPHCVVRPEGGVDRSGDPVEGDVGQERVEVDRTYAVERAREGRTGIYDVAVRHESDGALPPSYAPSAAG